LQHISNCYEQFFLFRYKTREQIKIIHDSTR